LQAGPISLATTLGISVDFFSSGYLDVSVRRVRFLIPILFRMGYSLRSGFPHSDISGSKLHCQLPRAFRRLARPSSPVIAKASTTCTYSLDPITLCSLSRSPGYRQLICATPRRCNGRSMQSQPYRWLFACRQPAIQPSSILLKSADQWSEQSTHLLDVLCSCH
jgi:hypothetical protein